jgi:hypothetical protein
MKVIIIKCIILDCNSDKDCEDNNLGHYCDKPEYMCKGKYAEGFVKTFDGQASNIESHRWGQMV